MNSVRATRSKIPDLTAIESAQNSPTPPKKMKKKDQSKENKKRSKGGGRNGFKPSVRS